MYKECVISPHHSGFEMFQCGEYNGPEWANENDLINEMRNNEFELYELGVDDLPTNIVDIRGSIYNEPNRIFGYIDHQGITRYVGISDFND